MATIPNLSFKCLTIVSDTLKSANQFKFHPRFNLITGNDNSIGKSTLAKLLLWTLGCEPEFDDTWKSFDVRVLVEFNIGNEVYQVGRYGTTMFLKKPNSDWERFEKITGAFSTAFSDIVHFKALLPNRNDPTKLETPPPSYYFLPFYIDQRYSWAKTWNSFINLGQYKLWQKTIIEYHTGYLSPEHFRIQEKIAENQVEKKEEQEQIQRIVTTIEIVKEYLPTNTKMIALTVDEFDNYVEEINVDLSDLQIRQEAILKESSDLHSEKVYLTSQLDLAMIASVELEKDYIFSVENTSGDILTCPICGTEHDNSLPSRASILADKDDAIHQVNEISKKLEKVEKKLLSLQKSLSEIRIQIKLINDKYTDDASEIEQSSSSSDSSSFIDGLASHSVQKHVQRTMEKKVALVKGIDRSNTDLRKEQSKLISKEDRESMDSAFKANLSQYVQDLNALGVNLSSVDSALNYNKLHGSGGAAESTRGLLAYYIAVLKQIYFANNEVFSSVIIDTPNQQEQADFNYEKILNFLMDKIPNNIQLILCAMNRPEVEEYKKKAHVIILGNGKILTPENYDVYRKVVSFESFVLQP